MPISPAFIKERARSLGFQAAGITDAAPFTKTQEVMLQRIDQGLFSGLPWFTPERARLPVTRESFFPMPAPSLPWRPLTTPMLLSRTQLARYPAAALPATPGAGIITRRFAPA